MLTEYCVGDYLYEVWKRAMIYNIPTKTLLANYGGCKVAYLLIVLITGPGLPDMQHIRSFDFISFSFIDFMPLKCLMSPSADCNFIIPLRGGIVSWGIRHVSVSEVMGLNYSWVKPANKLSINILNTT